MNEVLCGYTPEQFIPKVLTLSCMNFAESQSQIITHMFGFSILLKSVRVALLPLLLHVSRAFYVLSKCFQRTHTCRSNAHYLLEKFQFSINFPAAWDNLLTFSVALSKHRKKESEKKRAAINTFTLERGW